MMPFRNDISETTFGPEYEMSNAVSSFDESVFINYGQALQEKTLKRPIKPQEHWY